MIYLAAPYKDEDPSLMAERLEEVTRVAQKMIQAGLRVFSPLTYTCQFRVPPPDGWYEFDLDFLRLCDYVAVLVLPGLKDSHGIQLEIEVAKAEGITVEYIYPNMIGEFCRRRRAAL